ncbi:hypothetical protein QUC31_008940 [Theobroma cacao]
MDRRLPRSPSLKSPVLSPKSPAIYEKYKSGCALGLIHFFDFRQGHSHGKLISDKKRVNRQDKGDGYTRNRSDFLTNEEKDQCRDDALDSKNLGVNSRKPEVKRIIKEETPVKLQVKKNTAIAEMQNLQFNPKLVGHSKDHRKASKNSKKSSRFPARGCKDRATDGCRQPSNQNMVDKFNNNSASLTEASGDDEDTNNGGTYSCKSNGGGKHYRHTEINLRVHMNEAVEAFVNQKLTDGENLDRNELANRSKNFIDALEILNSNKELFTKLLQDPNSLLVKHIQGLRDSQAKNQQHQSSSKAKTSHCQPKEAGECEPSNTIVVLKPGMQNCPDRISNWPSPQSHYSLRKKERSARPAFLSFEHMKRKLRHAMRVNKKEQCQMSLDGIHKSQRDFEQFDEGGKEMSRQANEKISTGKSYLDVRKMSESSPEVNRRDGMGQTENFGSGPSGIGGKAASSTESCNGTSNLLTIRHLKGKFHSTKHLSEILNSGNEDLSRKQTLRTMDRLMSLPEYDLLPLLTPGRNKEHRFASPQMRFSPYNNFPTANGYKWRVQNEKKSSCLSSSPIKNLGADPMSDNEKPDDRLQGEKKSIPGNLSPATKVLPTVYSPSEDLSHKVNQTSVCPGNIMERNHADRWGESNALEPNGVQNTNTNPRTEAVNTFGDSELLECLKLDSPLGDQTSSSSVDVYSSSPFHIQRAEDSDSMTDRAEQPSPISVLEQFFVEDNTSSPSTISLAAEPPVGPFCIEELYASLLVESHLDLKSNAGTSTDKQGSLSEYIKAVLQKSGLNWGELSRKCHLSDQMLNSSLFDSVEVWPDKSCADRRLIFGYISEVLLEIYQCYFRCSPWVSLVNPRPRPVLLSKNVVHEVLRHVDWLLFSELPQQTLQQLVEKDLAKSRVWMDTGIDTEEVVTELVDHILEDLVVDIGDWLQT